MNRAATRDAFLTSGLTMLGAAAICQLIIHTIEWSLGLHLASIAFATTAVFMTGLAASLKRRN